MIRVLVAVALVGCEPGNEPAERPPAAVVVAPENAARVERATIQTGPRIAGSLDPRHRATVRAQAPGSLTAVNAELGQEVSEGELLARIEHAAETDALTSARAAVAAAKAQLAVARNEAERAQALVRGGALPERELETARSQLVAARAQLRQARAERASATTALANTRVVSPMRGVVSAANVRRGDVVTTGSELFTIIDPTTMRLEAFVPSEHLASLVPDVPVVFRVRGYPDRTFTGRITRVAPAADPDTRQIEILVDIPNPSRDLVAGLFADGRLAAAEKDVLVVPLAAVDTTGEIATVTRVSNGLVERLQVQLGERDEAAEVVEVREGLEPGDVVLLRSSRTLTPGTRVELPPHLSGSGREGATSER